MSSCAYHRTCGMATGAARIKPANGTRIRHALIETEGVVDVVNVAVTDAKVVFNFLWRERESIDHALSESWREGFGNIEKVVDVARLFFFPGRSLQFVRYPLHEKG